MEEKSLQQDSPQESEDAAAVFWSSTQQNSPKQVQLDRARVKVRTQGPVVWRPIRLTRG